MKSECFWAPVETRGRDREITSLDELIRKDDQVRLFDEILGGIDWTAWESQYKQSGFGQPAIHPRRIASAILYGLYRGIRSSRKLEEACNYRFDFLWLVEGRRIDHTTFAKFRTKFHEPLKDLFRQIGHIAIDRQLVSLGVVYRWPLRIEPLWPRESARSVGCVM